MKPKLILFLLLALSARAFAQTKNTISFVYAPTANGVITYSVVGDFGLHGKGGSQFGINYTRDINHTLSLQTGLFFANDDIQLTTVGPNSPGPKNGNIKLVTIPVIAQINFLKYFFVDGGLLADFETNYSANSADAANYMSTKQTGIGFEFGIGAKHNFGALNVFVNPFAQYHAVAKIGNDRNSSFNLLNSGFKFGVGYSF